MLKPYEAHWISKRRADAVRKSALAAGAMMLAAFKGIIVVAPHGMRLGDGKALSAQEAEYELQEAWCAEPKAKLESARKLLGLDQQKAAAGEQ